MTMIKIKEYYSDVYNEEEDYEVSCPHCNRVFLTGEVFLYIPEDSDCPEEETQERCPHCGDLLQHE
jgi:hypothetical protein